jgi:hypothetical protein
MGGKVAFAIIQKDKPEFTAIAWTGVDNHLFYSTEFVQGDTEKAIKNVVKEVKKYNKNFIDSKESKGISPCSYGLVVVNMEKKQVRSFQDYNFPMQIDLIVFKNQIISGSDLPLRELIEKDCLTVVDKKNNKEYSLIDFFGTTDVDKVRSGFFKNKENQFSEINFPNSSISKYNVLDNIVLKPKGIDFELIRYPISATGAVQMAQDLRDDGISFSNKENAGWKEFITNMEDDKTILKTCLENLENVFAEKKVVKIKMK